MKKVILIIFGLLLFLGCRENDFPPTSTIEELISYIPDHKIQEGSESYFTKEYYALLQEAWDIPSDGPGGIGSEEWLFYFLTGNGDNSPSDLGIESVYEKNSHVNVDFHIYGASHTLILDNSAGLWVIYDFDSTKEQLKEYIVKQRQYFKSSDWERFLQQLLDESDDNKDLVNKAKSDVTDYFNKYPN